MILLYPCLFSRCSVLATQEDTEDVQVEGVGRVREQRGEKGPDAASALVCFGVHARQNDFLYSSFKGH